MAKVTEFEIQRALCLWLDGHKNAPPALHPHAVYFHVPNGGGRSGVEGFRFKQSGVKAGVPDLLFLHRGKLHCLELKAQSGTVSEAQAIMQQRLWQAGAVVAVAYSLDEAKAIVRNWGLCC